MHTPENSVFIALVTATLMIGGIIGFFLFSMVKIHRNYVAQYELHSKARILSLEKERRLLVADLHDDFGPILSAVKFQLECIEPAEPHKKELINKAMTNLETVFNRIRDLARELGPRLSGGGEVLFAVERFLRKITAPIPLTVGFKPFHVPGLSEERALHIYRILQEIIHNMVKHARAEQFLINATLRDRHLQICTLDDGNGFKHEKNREGIGLENISIRAELLHASLEIRTEPGEGTMYIIQIPLEET